MYVQHWNQIWKTTRACRPVCSRWDQRGQNHGKWIIPYALISKPSKRRTPTILTYFGRIWFWTASRTLETISAPPTHLTAEKRNVFVYFFFIIEFLVFDEEIELMECTHIELMKHFCYCSLSFFLFSSGFSRCGTPASRKSWACSPLVYSLRWENPTTLPPQNPGENSSLRNP